MRILFTILCITHLSVTITYSQITEPICGIKYINDKIFSINKRVHSSNYEKTTNSIDTTVHTIPIVFHILLNDKQINEIGGIINIEHTLASLLENINASFSASSQDTNIIPPELKQFVGHTNIRFGLARRTPWNSTSKGYQVKVVPLSGFNIDGDIGSKIGFSDAKYSTFNGLSAWDVSSYINVWIVNPLINGRTTNLSGLTISNLLTKTYSIPEEEVGIIIGYSILKHSITYKSLIHELGHFFSLSHIWGDDDGLCLQNGGSDDGINDTPVQSGPTSGCPIFPFFDSCTNSGNGIFFMNYMDYSSNNCRVFFTKEQCQKMNATIAPAGNLFSLTMSEDILYPQSLAEDLTCDIVPNPIVEKLNILFNNTTKDLQKITILSVTGKIVFSESIVSQKRYYSFDISLLPVGTYILKAIFSNSQMIRKIYKQ